MPVYEYECCKCGKRFELQRGMTESDAALKCPGCGMGNPRRVFSVFNTSSSRGSCASGSST